MRLILPVVGVLLIIATLVSAPSKGWSDIDVFLSLLLGGTFIVSPFLALGIVTMYIAMLLVIVGFPFLGAYIGAKIGGRDSLSVWIGIFAGGYLGIKFAVSDFFDALMKQVRQIFNGDDESGIS